MDVFEVTSPLWRQGRVQQLILSLDTTVGSFLYYFICSMPSPLKNKQQQQQQQQQQQKY